MAYFEVRTVSFRECTCLIEVYTKICLETSGLAPNRSLLPVQRCILLKPMDFWGTVALQTHPYGVALTLFANKAAHNKYN